MMHLFSQAILLKLLGTILQYGMVFLMFYFLVNLLRSINQDFKVPFQQAENIPNAKRENRPESVHAKLKVIQGQNLLPNSVYDVGESLTIGRNIHTDICIDDDFVSHEHVCIANDEKGFLLTDLRSTNGTFVNGHKVSGKCLLTDGDEIKIGAVTFQFVR